MNLDWVLGALAWLALLACPLMLWCMRGMRAGSGGSCEKRDAAQPDGAKDEEIRVLKARLEELESRVASEEAWRSGSA